MKSRKIWLIAFEFAPFPGGQGTYATEITKAFSELGHEVNVICPQYPGAEDTLVPAATVHRKFIHQKMRLGDLASIAKLIGRGGSADLILCCDIRASLCVSALPWLRRVPTIAMFHGGEALHAEQGALGKLALRLGVVGKRSLVANSRYSAQLVIKHTGRQCAAIPLGVSDYWLRELNPACQEFENSELSSLPKAEKLVCLVGRLERRKGHLTALAVAKRINELIPHGWHMIFAGRVEDSAYAAEVQREVDATPNVLYVGQLSRSDIHLLYSRSRLLLLPAKTEPKHIEGFGLVILEAAARGAPAVATDVGGIADALIDGETGILCEEGEIGDLTSAVHKFLTDDACHESASQNALLFALRSTWTSVAEKTVDAIFRNEN